MIRISNDKNTYYSILVKDGGIFVEEKEMLLLGCNTLCDSMGVPVPLPGEVWNCVHVNILGLAHRERLRTARPREGDPSLWRGRCNFGEPVCNFTTPVQLQLWVRIFWLHNRARGGPLSRRQWAFCKIARFGWKSVHMIARRVQNVSRGFAQSIMPTTAMLLAGVVSIL